MALLLTACGGVSEGYRPLEFAELSAPGAMSVARVGPYEVAVHDSGPADASVTVVLLHGLGEHAGYWRTNVPALVAGGARVVVPDLLGYGRSDKPAVGASTDARGRPVNAYGPGAQAALTAGLLDALGITAPVVLVGHSMGGQIAIRFALTWPARVTRLVLLAPAGVERFTPGEARWLKRVSTPAAFARRDAAALDAHFRRYVLGRWSAEAAHHLEERVRVRRARDFDAYLGAVVGGIHGMLDEPVVDELGTLRPPVAVLIGASDGLIPNPVLHGGEPADVAAQARGALPAGARVEVVAGVGHMIQTEAPERVAAAILEVKP